MADNYDDDHLKVSSPNTEQPNNHKPSPDQVQMPPFLAKPPLNQNQTPTILTKPPLSFSFRCQHEQKYFCYLDFFKMNLLIYIYEALHSILLKGSLCLLGPQFSNWTH